MPLDLAAWRHGEATPRQEHTFVQMHTLLLHGHPAQLRSECRDVDRLVSFRDQADAVPAVPGLLYECALAVPNSRYCTYAHLELHLRRYCGHA